MLNRLLDARWVILFNALNQSKHFGVCLLDAHIRPQTSNHVVVEVANRLLPVVVTPGNGYKQFSGIVAELRSPDGKRERPWHNTDHFIRNPVEQNFMAQRLLRRSE